MSLGGRIIILLAIALVGGTLRNKLPLPGRIVWIQDWGHYIEAKALKEGIPLATLEETKRIVEEGRYIILDARPALDYEEGCIPGAISLPYDEIETEFEEVHMFLSPGQPILAYCSGETCDDSFHLCLFLRERGYTNLLLFAEGFQAWKAAQRSEGGTP